MDYTGIQALHIDANARVEKSEDRTQRKRALQIESLIMDLERRAGGLEHEITIEQNRAGITDLAHYAYPTYAKAAALRRDNLRRTVQELRAELQRSRPNGLARTIETIMG